MVEDGFQTRIMEPGELALAMEWAAGEGWNPGLSDAACFRCADPAGFVIGTLDEQPVATISVINYSAVFAFLGLYMVRPDMRGRGFGWRTWQAGMAHAGSRSVGLDGVPAQVERFRQSGFELAYHNIRYSGEVALPERMPAEVVDLRSVPFEVLEAYDATVFPALRSSFLETWIDAPGHVALGLVRGGALGGYGVIRRCRNGWKIGPLFADQRAGAEILFDALTVVTGGSQVFLDVPATNPTALALAQARGLEPVFETARMYTGPVRPIEIGRIFGVTSCELG